MFYHILSMVRTTDYGHTKAKSLILFDPNSDPNPKKIFKALFFVEIMVE